MSGVRCRDPSSAHVGAGPEKPPRQRSPRQTRPIVKRWAQRVRSGISQRLSTAFHQGSPKNPLFSPLVHQYHGDEFTTARKEIFTMLPKRIGFIGAGQMAEALAKGFISKGVSQPENM